jgi:catechol 2,3-dioxygenase
MTYQMHPEMTLGMVKLKVSNLKRSLDFYQNVVGFQILRQDDQSAELTADGKTTLVEIEAIPDALITPKRTVSGLYHYAILLPTRKDLGLALRKLMDIGLHVGHSDHSVSEALYITDPDQNGIEIYRDRPRSDWTYDANNRVTMGGELLDVAGVLREADGHTWVGLPVGTTIGHVHFHVGDLQQAKEFYCGLLGFDLVMHLEEFGALFVSAGGYHHHIGLNIWAGQGAPAAPAKATGIDYFTICLPNIEQISMIVKRLKEAGIPVEVHGDANWVTDPFGIKMKLVSTT